MLAKIRVFIRGAIGKHAPGHSWDIIQLLYLTAAKWEAKRGQAAFSRREQAAVLQGPS